MIAKAALAVAVARLREAGLDDPARDGRVLLSHAMGVPPQRLTLHLSDALSDAQAATFAAAIAARVLRKPVSQITGQRLFWGRSFCVTPDVLDPRPETEALVAAALDVPFGSVLDLGTGTGCILLTLLAERPGARGLGIDISAAALEVARGNAVSLGLIDRVSFVQGDWMDGFSGRFDLIVSNPPYIALHEMAGLAPEVRDHEPRVALTDEGDGLAAYRVIAGGAPFCLAGGGRLMVEIGPTQGPAVASLFAGHGFGDIRILPDMDGRDRVVVGRKHDGDAR